MQMLISNYYLLVVDLRPWVGVWWSDYDLLAAGEARQLLGGQPYLPLRQLVGSDYQGLVDLLCALRANHKGLICCLLGSQDDLLVYCWVAGLWSDEELLGAVLGGLNLLGSHGHLLVRGYVPQEGVASWQNSHFHRFFVFIHFLACSLLSWEVCL